MYLVTSKWIQATKSAHKIESFASSRISSENAKHFDHGLRTHDGYIPNYLQPKFKSQSKINIWDLDVK